MGLKEMQEELKEQIKEAIKAEEAPETPVIEEEKKETPVEEPVKEEKPEEKSTPEPVKTSSDYARERRDNAAMKAELNAAHARIAALEQAKPEPVREVSSDEPNRADDPQAWNEWAIKQNQSTLNASKKEIEDLKQWKANKEADDRKKEERNQAERELGGYESVVRQKTPDYEDAKAYYVNMMAGSIRVLNPTIKPDKLAEIVTDHFVRRASQLMNEGYENPVEALYEEAKNLGYKPKSAAANDDGNEEKVLKPDLNKVAANRSRNAGTAGVGNGRSDKGELTAQVASTMTNAEFAKLSKQEKQRLFGG